ncbi:MAG: excisionase family DNA-binding protein [Clostridia bacterium]|nr:excisionase family DNA-binding protein [Clostridia bacterium]
MSVEKVYYSVKETAVKTGLSQKYLRAGLNDGTIPHIKSGNKYLINLPLLIERLNQECKGAI